MTTAIDDLALIPLRSPERQQILPLSITKLYSEIREGRLTAVRIGARTYIARGELRRYVQELPRLGQRGAA
ncbi:helix-turn-helix domain-containing protein [Roseiarcaceae bacterium H3SJ34-1]|uniref:helix-turn-helix domain-containing protein n=1 Tax=Terripilifer ovatus TaxID=3032367 RepID=UPI003AB9468D|nr:helix-turn-helix domain-containing protein [Roseiarcaceae bacterium H3SJ34-1]